MNTTKKAKQELVYNDNKIVKRINMPEDFHLFYKEYINQNGTNDTEKSESFYKEQFYLYVKSKVDDFLYGEKDNIVFLLGAGASVLGKDWKYGKTMSRLACEIIKNLYFSKDSKSYERKILTLEDFAQLSNIPDPTELKDTVNKVLSETNADNTKDFELENFISTLNKILNLADKQGELFNSTKNPHYIEQVEKTRDLIQQQISKLVRYKAYPFDAGKESFQHLSIMKLLMSKLDKDDSKLEVVTTNYDKVIEKAAEKGKITVFDGFGFDSHPVFDDSWFDWNLSKKSQDSNTNEVEYKPNVIDLLKIHGSIDWFREKKEIVKKVNGKNVKKQVMIFPSSDKYKQSYDKPYFELMSHFQNILRKPNTLLLTSGFSFSDDHISRMIIDAVKINSGLRVLITDYSLSGSSYDKIKDLISNNYDVAILKASMNDKDENHGLHFYLN